MKEAFAENPELKHLEAMDVFRLFRTLAKSLQSYGHRWIVDDTVVVDKKPGHIDSVTGRIHPDIHQMGAATGRTSCSDPNVQNLPQEKFYRTPFVAPEGYVVITADYSGCELRILAELSQDPVWLEAFRNDWDLHSIIGELVFGDEWLKGAEPGCAYYEKKQKCGCALHKKLRDKRIKIINFSIAYGKTAHGLAIDMGITLEEAEDILARWRKANPVVNAYLEKSGQNARTYLKARTLSGRYRCWKRPNEFAATLLIQKDPGKGPKYKPTSNEIYRKMCSMMNSIEREGKNSEIQGSNADIIKRAMYYVWRDGRELGIKLCNMVHDELVAYAPIEKAQEAATFLVDCMKKAGAEFVKTLTMEAEYKVGPCWSK